MGIVEFLEARIAEDEAIASASGDVGADWLYIGEGDPVFPAGEGIVRSSSRREEILHEGTAHENVYVTFDRYVTCDYVSSEEGAHIARHDPARVLREVAAKRKLVRSIEGLVQHAYGYDSAGTVEEVLTPLAAIYSDHPDFNEEWRP